MNLQLTKTVLEAIKDDFKDLSKIKLKELYVGVEEAIDKIKSDDEKLEKLVNGVINEFSDEDDDDGTRELVLLDRLHKMVLVEWGDKFISNLRKYKSRNDEFKKLSGYGIIYEYWVEVDTDTREILGEEMDGMLFGV